MNEETEKAPEFQIFEILPKNATTTRLEAKRKEEEEARRQKEENVSIALVASASQPT